MEKKLDHLNDVLRMAQFPIKFSDNNHKMIQHWIDECDRVYNYTIRKFNENSKNFSTDFTKTKKIIFKELYGDKEKGVPFAILTDEVKRACANIKSCFTNLKRKHIKHFTIEEKERGDTRNIYLPYKSISKKGFYTTYLGDQVDFEKTLSFDEKTMKRKEIVFDLDDVKSDCRLQYNYKTGHYRLFLPVYYKRKPEEKKKKIVALDPGERIFLTFYSNEEYGMIGKDIRKPILKEQEKINKYNRYMKNNKNKKGKSIKHKKQFQEKINKSYKKIKGTVKELHNKTALFLCKNYDLILMTDFRTKKMLKTDEEWKKIREENKKKLGETIKKIREKRDKKALKEFGKRGKLNKKVKFVLQMLSFYRFKEHLVHKADEYGSKVEIVTEEYTSQCCGNCGMLGKRYKDRIKECENCKMRIHRDVNGARNILLKNMRPLAVATTVP